MAMRNTCSLLLGFKKLINHYHFYEWSLLYVVKFFVLPHACCLKILLMIHHFLRCKDSTTAPYDTSHDLRVHEAVD